jgi:prepilin-type N-terminal cleavage/methylation domain-containing protein
MGRVKTQLQVQAPQLRSKGFSLVEALVVVAVLLVLAAITVTHLLRARMKANESAAVANMRTINTAESMYFNTYPDVGYADSLAKLGSNGSDCQNPGKTNSCLIMDETLISGLKGGYMFELVSDGQLPSQAYTLTALPASKATSGTCSFTSNQTGVIAAESPGPPGRFSLASSTCDQPGSVAPAR